MRLQGLNSREIKLQLTQNKLWNSNREGDQVNGQRQSDAKKQLSLIRMTCCQKAQHSNTETHVHINLQNGSRIETPVSSGPRSGKSVAS